MVYTHLVLRYRVNFACVCACVCIYILCVNPHRSESESASIRDIKCASIGALARDHMIIVFAGFAR